MTDLIAFVRARLDDDEASIRALKVPHDWHTGPGDDPDWTDGELVCMWPPEFHTPYEQDKHWRGITISGPKLAAYVARHDPSRVLRGIAAKRAAVDEAAYWHEKALADEPHPMPSLAGRVVVTWAMLCALATEWNDHDDYNPDWVGSA